MYIHYIHTVHVQFIHTLMLESYRRNSRMKTLVFHLAKNKYINDIISVHLVYFALD